MKMIQLVYRSIPSSTTTEEVARAIRNQAAPANRARRLTGFLLYRPGRFVQVLEGPSIEVTRLLGSIIRDPRHHQMELLGTRRITARDFGLWSMGYVSLLDEIREAQNEGLDFTSDNYLDALHALSTLAKRAAPL